MQEGVPFIEENVRSHYKVKITPEGVQVVRTVTVSHLFGQDIYNYLDYAR